MSINFNTYNLDNKAVRMTTDELVAGQHLVRVITPESRWGDLSGTFRTTEYVVVKALKTQLVLENCENGSELRLRVENSKYSTFRNGQVSTDKIGDQGYNRTSYQFATEGDPIVEELRQHWEARLQEQTDKRNAQTAVNEIKNNLKHANLEQVEAAIASLQILADNLRAAQR